MRSPAETGGLSDRKSVVKAEQVTVMTSGGVIGLQSLEVFTLAVLVTVPNGQGAVSLVVGLTMWTWTVAPEARSVPGPPYWRTPPEIAQPGSVLAASGSIVQFRSALVGSVSETVTSCAVPRPLLVTVTS